MFLKEKSRSIQNTSEIEFDKPVKIFQKRIEEIHITLKKSDIGLGFTLGTCESDDKSCRNIFVKKILDFSPAKCDGRLKVGDRIKKINNTVVENMTQNDIVKFLRSLPIGEVIGLTIDRSLLRQIRFNTYSCEEITEHEKQNIDNNDLNYQVFHFIISVTNELDIIKHPHASGGVLGISVECRTNSCNSPETTLDKNSIETSGAQKISSRSQRQFFVKSILKNGSADQDGRLRIGDEILAVQGICVHTGQRFFFDKSTELFGDIFHYDLAPVFLRNLEKLNRLLELRESCLKCSENPLHLLKTLIKEAGLIYSSMSLVIRRLMNPTNQMPNPNFDIISRSCEGDKKILSELCRIENIFELNPDYRYNYNNIRSTMNRYKEEEFNEIHGRNHHERYILHRNSDYYDTDPASGVYSDNLCQDGYESDSNMFEAEELMTYYSKEEDENFNVNENEYKDACDLEEPYAPEPFEDEPLDQYFGSGD